MPVLDDLLRPNLKLVICGSAVGRKSAEAGAYYAGPGNKFWSVLHEVGLTSVRLKPTDFTKLLDYRIGLTDLAKSQSGNDAEIASNAYDPLALTERIRTFSPSRLAFNGKKAASVFLGRPTGKLDYGKQSGLIGSTEIWILPSTSGAANGFWSIRPWRDIARGL